MDCVMMVRFAPIKKLKIIMVDRFEDCGLCAEQALADEVGVDDVTKFEFQNDEIKKEAVEDGDGENDNKEDIFKEIFLDLGWMWTVLVVVVVLSGIFVSLWRHHGRTVAGQK
jgi:hypothetical protein